MNTEPTGYVVYQSGYAIMGAGSTLDAAIADANEWIGGAEPLTVDTVHQRWEGRNESEIYYARATQRLLDGVAARGGDIVYSERDDGSLDLA